MRLADAGKRDKEDFSDGWTSSRGGGEGAGVANVFRRAKLAEDDSPNGGAGAAIDVVWVDPPSDGDVMPPSRQNSNREGASGVSGGGVDEGEWSGPALSMVHPSDAEGSPRCTPVPPSFYDGYITTSRPYNTGQYHASLLSK
jgi:hypothetical protein